MEFQIFIENRALKKIEKLDSKTKNRILKALPKLQNLFRVKTDVVNLQVIQTNIVIGLVIIEFCLR